MSFETPNDSEKKEDKMQEETIDQKVEIINNLDEEAAREIAIIYKKSFPDNWDYIKKEDIDKDLADLVKDNNNLAFALKEGKTFVGLALLRPHNDVASELKEVDPNMNEDRERYYIETLYVLPGHRKQGGFLSLVQTIYNETGKRKINNFSMHARVTNKLSEKLQKLFADSITKVRRVNNWYYYGGEEPTDYIEISFKR